MKKITEIFAGTAVIIDNAFETDEKKADRIWEIKNSLENHHIPLVIYSELPEDETIPHFRNLSFIILDWELLPTEAEKANIDNNIDFLKKLNETCFIPIFIFSKQAPESIVAILKEHSIYKSNRGNIFVKSKVELVGEKNILFEEIENWINNTPSIYVLKEWELALNKAKYDLFTSLNNINTGWPCVLKSNFDSDSVDYGSELGALISRNLTSRMELLALNEKILDLKEDKIPRKDISQIIESEKYIKKELLNPSIINTGDIYYKDGKYLLNIRPTCDLIPRNGNSLDNIEIYCLKGSKLSEQKLSSSYNADYGNLIENDTNTIVFPIDNGRAVIFYFKKIYNYKYSEIKDNRKGRLLPPYLTKIQQKYSHYLQRPGLTRIPIESIPSE
ncbi:MAG: hypothetical protein ACOCWG_02595 [bacterium]